MKNPRPMPKMNDDAFDAIVDNLWDERCTSFEVWSEMGGGYLEFTRASRWVLCPDCHGAGEHADELSGDQIVTCMRCNGAGGCPDAASTHNDTKPGVHSATWHVRIVGTDGG